jgi:ATP-dependent DNA ligase
VHGASRNDNDFNLRYPGAVKDLANLPDETVIDGEVIALDEDGRPSFDILQNNGSSRTPVFYFVFDIILRGHSVMRETLAARRELLEKERVAEAGGTRALRAVWGGRSSVLIESVKAQGLEGLVTKRLDRRYEPGLRSGAWQKMRQPRAGFIIGGYTIGSRTFDTLIFSSSTPSCAPGMAKQASVSPAPFLDAAEAAETCRSIPVFRG